MVIGFYIKFYFVILIQDSELSELYIILTIYVKIFVVDKLVVGYTGSSGYFDNTSV